MCVCVCVCVSVCVFSLPEARIVYVFCYYKCETMQYLYSLCGIRSVIPPPSLPSYYPSLFFPTPIQNNVGEGFSTFSVKKDKRRMLRREMGDTLYCLIYS